MGEVDAMLIRYVCVFYMRCLGSLEQYLFIGSAQMEINWEQIYSVRSMCRIWIRFAQTIHEKCIGKLVCMQHTEPVVWFGANAIRKTIITWFVFCNLLSAVIVLLAGRFRFSAIEIMTNEIVEHCYIQFSIAGPYIIPNVQFMTFAIGLQFW